MQNNRYARLQNWLAQKFEHNRFAMQALNNDASFRHYYRVAANGQTFIASDMPPDKENPAAFKDITKILADNRVRVPLIHASDVADGLFLLDDFGNTTYLKALSDDNADSLYRLAIDELLKIQKIEAAIPSYDRTLLLEEMQLFADWYCKIHLGKKLSASDEKIIAQSYDYLIDNALEQPQVFVHRDYHSRNLMLCDDHSVGVLDYQDAVLGPITYDLVSLLTDCYIEWQPSQRLEWLRYFLANTPQRLDEERFMRWFDLMCIQRHLKTTGIFARLNHRDHKPAYLASIPRNLRYIKQAIAHHPDLAEMGAFIERLAQ